MVPPGQGHNQTDQQPLADMDNCNMAKERIALITGIAGQDGTYLTDLLLDKGYAVHGVDLKGSPTTDEIQDRARSAQQTFALHQGDLTDGPGLHRLIADIRPTEIYNLAAQSHVGHSFSQPELTTDINACGVLRLLEAIRNQDREISFFQASTSALYGQTTECPQNEATPFSPNSPYGIAKLYAHWLVRNYREAHGMPVCNGILFNHESPRRGPDFVTRKITLGLARIKRGRQDSLQLGNLEARRDWGHARDYVRAMWLMLQAEQPDDYVIASGTPYSVRQFVEAAAKALTIEINWQGTGLEEIGLDAKTGRTIISIAPEFYRPAEVDLTLGDASRIQEKLGWQPEILFTELAGEMARHDLELVDQEK